MSEIKNSTTDKTVAYVSGDGIFNATTGRKSQIIKDGKIYSSITGELIGTYSGGGSGSGGSSEGSGKYRVRFFDYDGTILKTVYTDGGAVTAPSVPEHERLLFQEWNNDFDNVTSDLDVGAIYTTKSGKCEFDVWVNAELYSQNTKLTDNTAFVGIGVTSGTVTVEWGDGATETLSTAGETRLSHTYASAGKYMISVSGTDLWYFLVKALCEGGNTRNNTVMDMRIANIPVGTKALAEVFANCFSCETISLDVSAARISNYGAMRESCSLKHFNFPRGYKTGYWTLATTASMQHVVFSFAESVTEIGFSALSSSGILDVVLPPSITKIQPEAFTQSAFKAGLSQITIPAKVTEIAFRAFHCTNSTRNLKTVIMKPTTPPTIALATGWNADTSFPTDGSLKEIIVPAGCGEAYKSATNWSYYADIIKEEE
jgi:hypothetical protein